MGNRHYPYIEDKNEIKDFTCETCGKQCEAGYEIEWRTSIFVGENEFERKCLSCFQEMEAEEERKWEERCRRADIAAQKEEEFWAKFKKRLEEKYQVQYFTEYQWRINGVIDVFPTNRCYHDIKNNIRGNYSDMFSFLDKFFKSKL